MILVIESVVLCLLFTGMIYAMSRDPIQDRVKSLPEYQGKIPTQKNRLAAKLGVSARFVL